MNQKKYVSTTALAKMKGVSTSEMFSQLVSDGLIEKDGKNWNLTQKGIEIGGIVKKARTSEIISHGRNLFILSPTQKQQN